MKTKSCQYYKYGIKIGMVKMTNFVVDSSFQWSNLSTKAKIYVQGSKTHLQALRVPTKNFLQVASDIVQ